MRIAQGITPVAIGTTADYRMNRCLLADSVIFVLVVRNGRNGHFFTGCSVQDGKSVVFVARTCGGFLVSKEVANEGVILAGFQKCVHEVDEMLLLVAGEPKCLSAGCLGVDDANCCVHAVVAFDAGCVALNDISLVKCVELGLEGIPHNELTVAVLGQICSHFT